jgi:hypothetical protein
MALPSGTEENIMPRHQPPSPTDGLGIRHTHGDMGQRRGKEGVLIVRRMGRKAADGAARKAPQLGTEGRSDGLAINYNGWNGE